MIVISGLLAAALVAVVVALSREHRRAVERLTTAHRDSEEAWTVERRELLNRVQHPEIVPVPERAPFEMPELEPDDSNLVGHISFDGPGGN